MRPFAPISTAQRRQRRSPITLRLAITTRRAAASTSTATCVGRGATHGAVDVAAPAAAVSSTIGSTRCDRAARSATSSRIARSSAARRRARPRARPSAITSIMSPMSPSARACAQQDVRGERDVGGGLDLTGERGRRAALDRGRIGEPGRGALAELGQQAERAHLDLIIDRDRRRSIAARDLRP